MKNPSLEFELHPKPPYCPNSKCAWHSIEVCSREGRFSKQGSRRVFRYPYVTKKFKCGRCGKIFSDSIFQLFYRDRTEPTYGEIFNDHNHGKSRRAIARDLGCSLDTVQRRFQELARQGLLIQSDKLKGLKIKESVAYDGIENFAFSQFDPNNVNHAVGRDSLFLYDFNFSPINRKGRMSPRQKLKDRRLANLHGRYPGDSIRLATRRMLMRLLERSEAGLVFHSDNHYAYRDAIRSLPKGARIEHVITLAKVARNYRNRLFAINHADMLTRQQLTTFKRETIAFSKHSIAMVESFTLFVVWKNFMRTMFTKKQRRDPRSNIDSPAMRLGLETQVLGFHEFYRVRLMPTQVVLNEDWMAFFNRCDPTSRRPIASNR